MYKHSYCDTQWKPVSLTHRLTTAYDAFTLYAN